MKAMDSSKVRLIAFYLPQYHPIPENDEWWGKGFTEWTNAAKALPLFKGHYQPHIPSDLGFYDLRLPEARLAQADLARNYGIEGFCYYHYWFGGKLLLQRPFEEVLDSGQPDFPFCICWANQTWTGIWHGAPNRILIEQAYPGEQDTRQHFDYLARAFSDPRYITVDGKPLFIIYNPDELPDSRKTTDLWRDLALRAGFNGLYLVAEHCDANWDPIAHGFDARVSVRLPPRRKVLESRLTWREPMRMLRYLYADMRSLPTIHQYEHVANHMIRLSDDQTVSYPCVIPNWDNTPRSGSNGMVLHGSTPELFGRLVRRAVQAVHGYPPEQRIVFVKSWNEWAEGNHLEPDLKYGRQYLEVLHKEIS